MIKSRYYIVIILFILAFTYCKKEKTCLTCGTNPSQVGNKSPIANVVSSIAIILPVDSVLLDGSGSRDPDGQITSYAWSLISGPSTPAIVNSTLAITMVKGLIAGNYGFELKITDNGGLTGVGYVQVVVINPGQSINRPPIANAGPDRSMTFPTTSTILDGSSSNDPDNNMVGFEWRNISGPIGSSIHNRSAMSTPVTNLVQGTYLFEIKVTDAGGLFSLDSVSVVVNSANPNNTNCDIASRQLVEAYLTPVGGLSIIRPNLAATAAGSKLFFAGGGTLNNPISRVDIYDISTNTWSTAELSEPRTSITAVGLGNKVFFAGGQEYNKTSTRVDIYDITNGSWSQTELSLGRTMMAAAAAGNKVLFAGGYNGNSNSATSFSATVEIYDVVTNTWNFVQLDNRRRDASCGISASVIGDKIYLAGASNDLPFFDYGDESSTINNYDASTNSWTTSNLSQARGCMAAIAVGNKNYWAGGKIPSLQPPSQYFYNEVEIRDMNTGQSSFACLFQPNAGFYKDFQAVLKNNKIIFFTGAGIDKSRFDIYDISTNTWSIGELPLAIDGGNILSINNTIYICGGNLNGCQVWKLDF